MLPGSPTQREPSFVGTAQGGTCFGLLGWHGLGPAAARNSESFREPSSAEVFFWDALSGKCLESLRQNRRATPHTPRSLSRQLISRQNHLFPFPYPISSLSLSLSLSLSQGPPGERPVCRLLGLREAPRHHQPGAPEPPADSRSDEDVDEDFFSDTLFFLLISAYPNFAFAILSEGSVTLWPLALLVSCCSCHLTVAVHAASGPLPPAADH